MTAYRAQITICALFFSLCPSRQLWVIATDAMVACLDLANNFIGDYSPIIMDTINEKFPDPKELEKELGNFLTKKFGGSVKLATPIVVPQGRRE